MKLKMLVFAACATFVPALALAGSTWTEMYRGMGSDASRDNACSAANSSAVMNAAAACIARRGFQGGQNDQGCSCQCNQFGDSQICTCTDTIQITCESNK
jgi:hypothetical protein